MYGYHCDPEFWLRGYLPKMFGDFIYFTHNFGTSPEPLPTYWQISARLAMGLLLALGLPLRR
jgi:hypothetical protein